MVDKSRYLVPIGSLSLSVDEIDAFTKYEGEGFYDEMLVMKFYNPYMLDTFLKGFKAMKIAPVALKAVLTETNSQWDSIRLHDELLEEHRAMHGL